ncbi:MAG: N-acetylmuramoyl-L-alanine amidase [Desulfotomaculaceae bacterium]|nr:N-acetylmuramoyl-L-alanine amidase [Desulfotomaculaceae bacterium]
MPAVLVEIAFLSNPNELKKLVSPYFQNTAAQSIARGIGDYLGLTLEVEVTPAPALPKVKIEVRGTTFEGVLINTGGKDTAFGPVRAIAEALGAKVEWDGANKTVIVK